MGAFIGDKQLCEVVCSNKKDGRKEAADKALRALIASGQYNVETTVSLILSICTLKVISAAMTVYANYFYDTSVIFSNSFITYREPFRICIGHDRRTDVNGIDCHERKIVLTFILDQTY